MARFLFVALFAVFASGAEARVHRPARVTSPSWQTLARKVGQSEEGREAAIQSLRHLPTLIADLHRGLKGDDRPLALEVIGALELQSFVPDLLSLVGTDSDGFTTLALNGLMTEKNSGQILRAYTDLLGHFSSLSDPVVIAMLEPLARKNVRVPRAVLEKIAAAPSPDLRSGLLYYLRVMALRNGVDSDLDLVTNMIRAPEGQVRLQAVSISAELSSKPRVTTHALKSKEELNEICSRESALREACLSVLTHDVAVAR